MATAIGFPYLEKEASQFSISTVDSTEEHTNVDAIVNRRWKYDEVLDLLQIQLAVLPGNRDKNGHPVIVMSSGEGHLFLVANVGRLISYLSHIPNESVRGQGFTILLDMRHGTWSVMRKALEALKLTFVEHVHQVIIMKPKSLWQRGRTSVNFNLKKSKYKFKCVLLEHSVDIFHYISPDHVLQSQNGQFEYNHSEWMKIQESIEKFMLELTSKKEGYLNLQEIFDKQEESVDLEEAKAAVKSHISLFERIDKPGLETLLAHVLQSVTHLQPSNTNPDFEVAFGNINELCHSLQLMLIYINELWQSKGDALDHALQFKIFESDAALHTLWLQDQVSYLSHELTKTGFDISSSHTCKQHIEEYRKKINDKHHEISRVIEVGQRLLALKHPSSHMIANQIDDISTKWEKLTDSVEERMALMIVSFTFHEKEEKFICQIETWIDQCSSMYSPPNITSTEDALEQHKQLFELISTVYITARQDGHTLIDKLRRPVGERGVPVEFIHATRHAKEKLESLYDEKNMIDEQWKIRQDYLRKTLNFQLFQKECKKIYTWISDTGNIFLVKSTSIGVHVDSAGLLLKSHDSFESGTEAIYSQFNILQSQAKELSTSKECRQEELDSEVSNLEVAINNFAMRLDDRRDILVLAIQCFKASDNFLKEAANLSTNLPTTRFEGPTSEVEERLIRYRLHRGVINNIASTTLQLWNALKKRFEASVQLSEGSNFVINYSSAVRTVEENLKQGEKEQSKLESISHLREKRWELSLSRHILIKDIDEYLLQLESWTQESESELADNIDDAQMQFDVFERQYNEHLEKQSKMINNGEVINDEIETLDTEVFNGGQKGENHNHEMLDAAVFNLTKAKDKMITDAGVRLKALEECVQYYFLQQRFHKLTLSLNQLSLSLSQSVEVCLKREDVCTMEQNVKQIENNLMMVAQDVEAFASSVSECLQKRHYQSASLNVLNRTVTEKMIFVKDTLTARQRVVQSSVELFSNYDKLQSTMEYCQVQFTSRESGQSLNDINSRQESLKELKESLMEAVAVVKSQAKQLKSVIGGPEQNSSQLVSSESPTTDNTPRLLVAPKRIRVEKSSSASPAVHNQSVLDDLMGKMDVRVSRLNRLWDTRLMRLEQSKQVIEFETEVPKVLKWLDEAGSTFSTHRHEYGSSLEDVQQFLQNHDTFYHNIVMPMFQKVKELRNKISLFEESGHYELNRIRSIGNHLEQQWLKFDTEVQTRLANLKLSLSFQENMFQGSNWCMQSEQFFHSLNDKINHCDTSDEASSLSAELSIYLSVTKSEQLDRVSKIQQISGFLHSNPLSEQAANLDQSTQQILKDFVIIQQELDTLHAKLSHIEKEKDKEMRLIKQKARVIEELITTEEVYVRDLKLVVETYKPRFISEFLPESLKGKEAIVFGNIQWIAEFHMEVLWPQIQRADTDADLIAQVFIDNVDAMTDLYVPYCQNKTKSEELLASHRSYLTRVSSLFGTDIPLSSLLIKPIQRITKYPLLLMDCLKYTQQIGQPSHLLELAVQAVEEIPVQTNNAIHLSLLKSEEGLKWHKYGELLYQGSLLVSEPRLLITSEKERQLFLFDNTVVFARRIDQGQAKFTYEYKFRIPLTAGVQVLEFIEGEPFKFAFFTSDHRMHLKANSLDTKHKWIKCLKASIQKHIDEEENKIRSLSVSHTRLRSNAVLTGDAVARDLSERSHSSSPFLPRRPNSPFSTTRINLHYKDTSSSPPPVAFERYRVTDDYIPLKDDHHGVSLKKNQIVEVMEQLDTGRWFIQATSITGQVEHGWVPSSLLEAVIAETETLLEPPEQKNRTRRYTENFSNKDLTSHQVISTLKKVTLGEVRSPKQSNHRSVLRQQVIIDIGDIQESKSEQVVIQKPEQVSSHHLPKEGNADDQKSLTPRKFKRKGVVRRRSSSRSEHDKNSSDDEEDDESQRSVSPASVSSMAEEQLKREKAEEKIRYIMAELYETEKEYVHKLDKLVNGFLHHIQENDNLPDTLQGKERMIFGNVAAIYEFHKHVFQEMLEKTNNSQDAIAQCFLDKRSDFKMYVTYCENKPKSESFIWTYTHQGGAFFKDIQSKLGLREDIASFLIKPVQRITKYQLLLKDLLKSSQKAGHEVPLLEEAVQLMQDVPKQANDAMALSMIVGYHGNIHANGQIVLQDEFTVYERARWAVGARRHVFLLDLMMIITKEKDNDGLYVFKDSLKVHNMTLTEKQADSPCRFAIGTGQIGDWDKYYILEISTNEKKQDWIRTIKEILNQQFEMLKALKQPNIRGRSSTVDTVIVPQGRDSTSSKDILTNQPSVFHDMSDSSLDDSSGEEETESTTGGPENNQEQSGGISSSKNSNLFIAGEDCPAPVQGQYIFNLKKGQVFSVVNSTGDWWLARLVQDVPNGNVTPGTEGWIPCTFMEPFVGELLPEKDHIVTKQKAQSNQYSTLPARMTDLGTHSRGIRSSLFPGLLSKYDAKKKIVKQKIKTHVPCISVPLSDDSVLCGHAIEFCCEVVEEDTNQKVTWFHNNCAIGESITCYTSGRVCTLKIDNAVPKDEGLYTCRITVNGQQTSSSAKLTVLRCPDPPGQPKIKLITSTSVSLSWDPPSFDGHSPITVYLVECKDVCGNRWSTLMNRISEPATIVDDLVPDTDYIFTVIAVNHIGCSLSSVESALIKMACNDSPNNLYSLEPFEDHYTLKNQISSGQFSTVYECLHKATQQTYVAKLLPLHAGSNYAAHRELNILSQISHPNLVCMSSAYQTENHFIIVMQYIHGLPVYNYFTQRKASTEADVANYCQQLCCGLQYLHERHIAHLAIKPHNMLVLDTGYNSSFTVQVIHMSSAQFVQSDVTVASSGYSIDYEAPEVLLEEPVHTATDMWSVGVLLYTLLSGSSPFLVDSIDSTRHNIKEVQFTFPLESFRGVSHEVKSLINQLLHRTPSKRINSTQFLHHQWVKSRKTTKLPNISKLERFLTNHGTSSSS